MTGRDSLASLLGASCCLLPPFLRNATQTEELRFSCRAAKQRSCAFHVAFALAFRRKAKHSTCLPGFTPRWSYSRSTVRRQSDGSPRHCESRSLLGGRSLSWSAFRKRAVGGAGSDRLRLTHPAGSHPQNINCSVYVPVMVTVTLRAIPLSHI